jgi:hypothetical protein
MLKKILFLGFIAAGLTAHADPLGSEPELAAYFRTQLLKVDAYREAAPPIVAGDAFPLEDVNIDIAPQVSFGISSVFQLSVAPEIDFVLQPDFLPPAPSPVQPIAPGSGS